MRPIPATPKHSGLWRRRRLASVLGASLSVFVAPVALAAAPPGSTVLISNTPTASTLTMVNATTGWAFDGNAIVRTTNGGRLWTSVTPPDLTIQKNLGTINAVWDFLSATSAWIAEQPTPSGMMHFWFTDDGGKRWIEHTHTFAVSPYTTMTTIDFLNAHQGWIGWGLELWATDNGGQSWHREVITKMALPTTATVTFTSPTSGWAVVPDAGKVTSGFFIYRSNNHGVTWKATSIKQVPGLYAMETAPTFSGQTGLLATYRSGSNAVVALRTSDGGQQWTTLSPSVMNTLSSSDAWGMQTVGGTTAWAITEGRLWRYTNGDVAWTYRSADRFFAHVSGMDFLNAQTGWVWKANPHGITQIWMTTSGGTRWTTWTPDIALPPS